MKTYPKKTSKAFVPKIINGMTNPAAFTERKKPLENYGTPEWVNADGSTNWDKKNAFLAQRELDARNSSSQFSNL